VLFGEHLAVPAGQLQKSIPRVCRGIDVKSQFPLPLTLSMAPTAELNCLSKDLGLVEGGDRRVLFGEHLAVLYS